jgi:hypothetical protein
VCIVHQPSHVKREFVLDTPANTVSQLYVYMHMAPQLNAPTQIVIANMKRNSGLMLEQAIR